MKAGLLGCLKTLMESDACVDNVDVVILDGAAVMHFLQPAVAKSFDNCAANIFQPYILAQRAPGSDIILDQINHHDKRPNG